MPAPDWTQPLPPLTPHNLRAAVDMASRNIVANAKPDHSTESNRRLAYRSAQLQNQSLDLDLSSSAHMN